MAIDFSRCSGGLSSRTIYVNMLNPAEIEDAERLLYWDKDAQARITELEKNISRLREYRTLLYDRMQELETMPRKVKVTCWRERKYGFGEPDKIIYRLSLSYVYEDGTQATQSSTVYTGKERHKAIKAYKELLKQHPGCLTEINFNLR